MKCLRCGNERYFFKDHGSWYCQKCVSYGRLDVGLFPEKPILSKQIIQIKPKLKYPLTQLQSLVSQQIIHYLKQGMDVFLYAATGAGKTECTLGAIVEYLSQGKKVGFAISRRQVVLEIADRLQTIFPTLHVVPVAQGYTNQTDGDLIVCTMHQLYRYPFTFDLLVMDEIDAFPYAGDECLHCIANQSCVGQKLCLSATPDQENMDLIEQGKMKMVSLFERPHKHLLPVPEVYKGPILFQVYWLIHFCSLFIKEKKQILLFVPTKQAAQTMGSIFSLFTKVCVVHSQVKNRDEIIARFRNKEMNICITTTLLERGITLPSVQVIVWNGEHEVFTAASLVQIFGRVGRSFTDPEGRGIYLCQKKSLAIGQCISLIQTMNQSVQCV